MHGDDPVVQQAIVDRAAQVVAARRRRGDSPASRSDGEQPLVDLIRRVRAGDARIRSLRSASYGDGLVEVAIASTAGITVEYRRTGCSLVAYAIAGDADDTQTGFGYSVGRAPAELDADPGRVAAPGRRVDRADSPDRPGGPRRSRRHRSSCCSPRPGP